MLKYIMTKNVTYGGQLFRGRKIIGEEKMLALIYPLIGKAIFTWGWRSKKEQEEMVAKGTSKTMDSNHRRGVAFDVWNWKECESDLKKIGFINDLKPWDPGHFPFGGEDKARKNYQIIPALPKVLEEYMPAIPVADKKIEIPVEVPAPIKMETHPIAIPEQSSPTQEVSAPTQTYTKTDESIQKTTGDTIPIDLSFIWKILKNIFSLLFKK